MDLLETRLSVERSRVLKKEFSVGDRFVVGKFVKSQSPETFLANKNGKNGRVMTCFLLSCRRLEVEC